MGRLPGLVETIERVRVPAPVTSLGLIGLLVAVFVLLNIGANPATEEGKDFIKSVPWIAWRAIGAAAVVVFVLLLIVASRVLLTRASQCLRAPWPWVVGYLALAAVLVGLIIAGIVVGGGRNPDLPVPYLPYRTRVVLFSGLVVAVPWLAIAWLCRDECRPPDRRLWGPTMELEYLDLQRLWRTIYLCIGAFAVGVVAALVTAGALRFAFLSIAKECGSDRLPVGRRSAGLRCTEDFPATDVLLYGAAFALILLMVAMPLIVAWRAQALAWVRRQEPLPRAAVPTEEWTQESSRLRDLLGLNTPLLRDPLTLLSVFAPIITSTLAAFLPELGT